MQHIDVAAARPDLGGGDRGDAPEGRARRGWSKAIVMDYSDVGPKHERKGPAISPQQRTLIGAEVHETAPVVFNDSDGGLAAWTCRDRRVGVLQVGDVVDKGDHREVNVGIFYNCTQHNTAKYRVEKKDGRWVVTATLGEWS